MDLGTIIKLGAAILILAGRERMPRRAAALIGVVFVILGVIELFTGGGPYFRLVGVAWLFVGATYLVFLIPGTTAWLRPGPTK